MPDPFSPHSYKNGGDESGLGTRLAEDASNEMHDIDWEKAEVVDCHPHYRQRCALEAWHIRTEPHTMNRDGGPLQTV